MTQGGPPIQVLCLLSGSVDSQLAVCLLREQGIVVRGLTFRHPLADPGPARAAAIRLGIACEEEDITAEFLKVLLRLKARDCESGEACMLYHIRLLRRAYERMSELRCDCICTGSVVNERHPWQTEQGYMHADRRGGCEGVVLRPLSAGLLPETIAEKEGWVRRESLSSLVGPSRKARGELAERYGLTHYGLSCTRCTLADPVFARRVEDLRDHEGLHDARMIQLLRMGRHFRIGDRAKLVMGRDASENAMIEGGAELYDLLLKVDPGTGPTGIMPISASEDEILLGAGICIRYSDVVSNGLVRVRVRTSRGVNHLNVPPLSEAEVELFKVEGKGNVVT